MRKLIGILMIVTLIVAVICADAKYGIITSLVKGPMTEAEKEQFLEDLYAGMLRRDSEIILYYYGDNEEMQEFVTGAVKKIYEMDKKDTSSDFDYMRYVHKVSNILMSGWGKKYKIVYQMEYLESKHETELVDEEVGRILKKIIKKNMTAPQKIRKIHDYVVEHVEYDTSTNRNSPYAALYNRSSACQGYATLIYKMMTEAGVPCRVITGSAKGGLHAWNIVKIKDKWYNIDATWDDPVGGFGKERMKYDYYLKGNLGFWDHDRAEEFNTAAFNEAYPMAKNNYHS